MDQTKLKILVIEDEELDAEVIKKNLALNKFEILEAKTLATGISLISNHKDIDAILLDLNLPDSEGFDTLKSVQSLAPNIAIIILTGIDDQQVVSSSLQTGAQDYLIKGVFNSKGLIRSIYYSIERKQFELRLKESIDLNQQIFSATTQGIITFKASGQCVFANEAAGTIVNCTIDKLLTQNFHELESWKRAGLHDFACEVLKTGAPKQGEVNFTTTFGREIWVDFFMSSFSRNGETHLLLMLNDKTNKVHIAQALEWKNYLLDMLLEYSPEQIYFKDLEGHITELSKTMVKKLGFNDPKEVIGKTDFDLYSDFHAQRAFQDEQNIIRSGQGMYNYEERETYPDSPDTWVLTSKMPLYNSKGKLIGTFGISKDITDRKKAEQALISSKMQLDEAMEVAQLYQWSFDLKTRCFIVDEKLLNFLGKIDPNNKPYEIPASEFIEKYVHPEDRIIVENDFIKARNAPDSYYLSQIEYRILVHNNDVKHIMVRTRVELNSAKEPVRFYGILQDITERKLAIQEAFESLHQVDSIKTEFLSLISQEIRTPLNGIVGAINLIKNLEGSAALKNLVETLDRSIYNLESFTENTTYYSKLINRYDLNISHFQVKELIQFAILENENLIVNKNIRISFGDRQIKPFINGDKDLVYKAISNIIQLLTSVSVVNAKITIDITEEEHVVKCMFVNSGNIFPEDLLKSYNSVSYQFNNKQLGLSLHIVKLIMDIHKGELQIFNNEAQSSTVKLIFNKQ
jgi:PAS domain S-box-containing protein